MNRTITQISKHGITVSTAFKQYSVDFGRRDTADCSDWDDSQDFLTYGEAHAFAYRASHNGKHTYVVLNGLAELNGYPEFYPIAEYPIVEPQPAAL